MLDKFLEKMNIQSHEEQEKAHHEAVRMEQQHQEEREEFIQQERFKLMVCEKLSRYLDEEYIRQTQPASKDEVFHIDSYGTVVDGEGFSYNYLLVSDGDKDKEVEIEYKSVRYSLTLSEGLNKLNTLSGSRIKAISGDVTVVLVKTNTKLH